MLIPRDIWELAATVPLPPGPKELVTKGPLPKEAATKVPLPKEVGTPVPLAPAPATKVLVGCLEDWVTGAAWVQVRQGL